MKTSQIFAMSALIISGVFFSVLSLFELSFIEWFISDVILGVILYFSYLVIALVWGGSELNYSRFLKKATVQE